ncbi:plasmid recombination protein [Sporosarcina sp. FSL K6-5500]
MLFLFENEVSEIAHVQKHTKANMQGLSNHLDRKIENHSNKDIDIERTHLNYDLCEKEGDTLSRMNERLAEVYCMKRKDVKACCEWIVTLPEPLKDAPDEHQRKFFEEKPMNFSLIDTGASRTLFRQMYIMTKQHHTFTLLLFPLFGMRKKNGKKCRPKK